MKWTWTPATPPTSRSETTRDALELGARADVADVRRGVDEDASPRADLFERARALEVAPDEGERAVAGRAHPEILRAGKVANERADAVPPGARGAYECVPNSPRRSGQRDVHVGLWCSAHTATPRGKSSRSASVGERRGGARFAVCFGRCRAFLPDRSARGRWRETWIDLPR